MEEKKITKIQFEINPELKERIFAKIKAEKYSTVSEFFRQLVRKEIGEVE